MESVATESFWFISLNQKNENLVENLVKRCRMQIRERERERERERAVLMDLTQIIMNGELLQVTRSAHTNSIPKLRSAASNFL